MIDVIRNGGVLSLSKSSRHSADEEFSYLFLIERWLSRALARIFLEFGVDIDWDERGGSLGRKHC